MSTAHTERSTFLSRLGLEFPIFQAPTGGSAGPERAAAVSGERGFASTSPRADMSGAVLDTALYAGTSCAAIRDIPAAASLVRRLWAECQLCTKRCDPQR
jgi:hypothetical protein